MMITRRQLRELILEATIDYVDEKGKRKAVKADGIFSNNSLRLQLQGYYNDAYDKFLKYQNNLIGDQYPELAKDLAHTSSFNQAKDEFQEYLENSVSSKYGMDASIKFGSQDLFDEVPNEYINFSQIIDDMQSKKIKYNDKFRDFPSISKDEFDLDFDDYEPFNFKTEPISDEEEEEHIQNQLDREAKRRELGSNLSFMFGNTVPRDEYPETTVPRKEYQSLEDLMNADTDPPRGR